MKTKGLSPVIAIALLILVTVALISVIVVWTGSFSLDAMETASEIQEGIAASPKPWECEGKLVFHGKIYDTVKIGDQCWMAENLKTTLYKNNEPIPNITSESEWANATDAAYCWYDNNEEKSALGALYNWHAVNNANELCPDGWRIPSDGDWKEMEIEIGMSQGEADSTAWRGSNEGSKIAGYADLWNTGSLKASPVFAETGFNALPASYRKADGNFDTLNSIARFWTSSPENGEAWQRHLQANEARVHRGTDPLTLGASVRCIKN